MTKKELNYDALDALLQYKTTRQFCADYLQVSEDTIERRLKEDKGMTFTEYQKVRSGKMAVKLQQKAIDLAMAGNPTMMIFCLKNLAGWADKMDHGVTEEAKEGLKLAYSIKN